MVWIIKAFLLILIAVLVVGCPCRYGCPVRKEVSEVESKENKVEKSEQQWCRELTGEEYRILRKKGTEQAFTGKYWNSKEAGIYKCAGCGNELFSSDTKFDSGTGWPSYYKPVAEENVETASDRSSFMSRTEVLCANCGGHLGHVFKDGPQPTGLRYCINGNALDFENEEESSKK